MRDFFKTTEQANLRMTMVLVWSQVVDVSDCFLFLAKIYSNQTIKVTPKGGETVEDLFSPNGIKKFSFK